MQLRRIFYLPDGKRRFHSHSHQVRNLLLKKLEKGLFLVILHIQTRLLDMVLLSFDTEEFDLPREHGIDISLEKGIEVSMIGTNRILDILKEKEVKATFFCTVNFAQNAPQVMQRIITEGHEVASHSVDHWQQTEADVARSKEMLEQMCGCQVNGYRQPRMFPISDEVIEQAGYLYNSSLHPAFIPGRYMHLDVPRRPFKTGKLLQIPASVSPWLRLPVFWLACHNYPQWLYRRLCLWTVRHDGQFVIYFHPWEFYPLAGHPEWKVPYIISRHSGDGMVKRLRALIDTFKHEHEQFVTFTQFTQMQ